MLKELDVGKKDVASELIKNAPGPAGDDFIIRNRLNRLKNRQEFENNYNNNNLSPPPSPPSPPPFFFTATTTTVTTSSTSSATIFTTTTTYFSTFSTTTTFNMRKKEKIKDKVSEEIDDKIYKIPDLPKLELGDGLVNILGTEAGDVLKENFVNPKKLEDEAFENIKEEYGFEEIKDAFDEASFPEQLEFFYGGDKDNFVQAYNFLSLNEDNNEFISFLCSDNGHNIMVNNSLSIHTESGSIFYQNFNTNENFYSFLLAQQDETKAITPKPISYHYSFETYIKTYLSSFSVDDIEKFDLYANKNSKYLLYKFDDWIVFAGSRKTYYSTYSKSKRF